MSSVTGHAKNIANFENLISFVTGYGTQYNPSNKNITLPGLQALRVSAQGSLDSLYSSTTTYVNAINNRLTAFEDLKKFSTRILNAVGASGVSANTIVDAEGINRKIQGTRAGKLTRADAGIIATKTAPAAGTPAGTAADGTPPDAAGGDTITHNSVSQQSFDNLIEHFARFITMLGSEPLYSPNEPELAMKGLNTKLSTMRSTNTAVIDAYTKLSNDRITRNNILYGDTNGLCDVANQVKNYVKSLYGASSPNYRLISKLPFKKQVI